LLGSMGYRDVAIIFEQSVAIAFINAANALHAETVQLGSAQGAHARRAVNMNAFAQGIEDFLVPDRGYALEITVDDADSARMILDRTVDIAVGGGRANIERAQLTQIRGAQRRTEEDDRFAHWCTARPRRSPPRGRSSGRWGGSSPGTTTRATATPVPSFERSQRTAEGKPAPLMRDNSQSTSSRWVSKR